VTTGLRTWFDKAGHTAQSLTVLAAALTLLALAFILWRTLRRALRGKKAADALTVVAAAMASSVAATGMWHFFSRTMHLPVWIQAVLFAFMEISVLASALRARANVARDGNAGADGLAVWVLTSASGLMSASEAASFQEALVRLGAPLVAAWLWERSMVPERRAQKAAQGTAEAAVRWLFSVKRIAVRLGLATALGADLETEDANRRIDRFVRADNRAQRAGRLTRGHAANRRDRAHARLMEQARMQADPRALYAHLGRQAILDVLARLGGDDAVIDRERARQMQHILADAIAAVPEKAATATVTAAPAPAHPDDTASATAPTPAPAAPARHTPLDPIVIQPPEQVTIAVPEAVQDTQATAQATVQPTPRQDELPLQLPAQPIQVADAANGATPGIHIPGARHRQHAAPPANNHIANGQQPVSTTTGAPAAPAVPAPTNGNRAHIPVEPVRFVAAPLPEPDPEPAPPAHPYTAYQPEPDPEPEPEPVYEPEPAPAALRPPAAVRRPLLDQRLAERITKAMAAAASANTQTQPNLLKLANELGISPGLMHDTIEALGGFNALWSRVRQDQDAETPETDLTFYPA